MNAGDTFIPVRLNKHLWIVISDPEFDPVVIVNLTTFTIDEEQACIVQKDEHPFATHTSAIRYKDGRVANQESLNHLLKRDLLVPHAACSQLLLQRIRDGASISEFLPEECRDMLDAQGLI